MIIGTVPCNYRQSCVELYSDATSGMNRETVTTDGQNKMRTCKIVEGRFQKAA